VPPTSRVAALAHTNRLGDVYYLHAGRSKTGKPRYFVARTVRNGALGALPSGYQLTESINGVVSVSRIDASAPTVPSRDLDLVRAALGRHPHLRFHGVDLVKGAIVVFEPSGGFAEDALSEMSKAFGMSAGLFAERMAGPRARTKYSPVMKFVPDGTDAYLVHRMTYRGRGGWSWALSRAPLATLVAKYLQHVGTEQFFDLM
jgi:hypothetical protein